MSRMSIEIELDNAAFETLPGMEVATILRGFADKIEFKASSELDKFRLFDSNGNCVGSADFYFDDEESEADRIYNADRLKREEAALKVVRGMTREDVVMCLENLCGIQCYDNEGIGMLREALVQGIIDGDTSVEEIQTAFDGRI